MSLRGDAVAEDSVPATYPGTTALTRMSSRPCRPAFDGGWKPSDFEND